MKAVIKNFGSFEVTDPDDGNVQLNLFPVPFHHAKFIKLPNSFHSWERNIENILRYIPHHEGSSNQHYVTIDSQFFTQDETLRRPGVHIDGNFCADPDFRHATWGGTTTTWGGVRHDGVNITTKWVSPYGITPPVGKYVSDDLGGIFCASSYVGCQAWEGEFPDGLIGDEGNCRDLLPRLQNMFAEVLQPHQLYFMTSNTPHDSLIIPKGNRRTLIRVTLAHDFPNRLVLDKV